MLFTNIKAALLNIFHEQLPLNFVLLFFVVLAMTPINRYNIVLKLLRSGKAKTLLHLVRQFFLLKAAL